MPEVFILLNFEIPYGSKLCRQSVLQVPYLQLSIALEINCLGIETELPIPELDDNQIEYTIDKLKPCTLYTFDLFVVGEKDHVTTKAKTNCAESIATTSKPTGLLNTSKGK